MEKGIWVPAFVLGVTMLVKCGYSSQMLFQGPWWDSSATSWCQFKPNASKTVVMECDYNDIPYFMANIRAGQLPSTVRTIRISNAQQVSVARDTFSSLYSLKNIYISHIQTLRISRNNWTQIERPEEVTITIEHVSQLILDSGTFSGWSEHGPKIVIRNVTKCFVAASAFDSGSVIQKVTFENIGSLWLKNGSFRADIDQLELQNVSLTNGCQSGSFGGRIGNLSLSSVWMGGIYSRCLQADEGWDSLEVRFSSLGNIHRFGISGSINDVIMVDSHLGCINANGLHVIASTFTMNRCVVKELASNALDVHFIRSASLQASTITFIRANAFSRMMSRAGVASTLTIRRVSVDTVEDRSLAFSEQTQPALLDVVLLDACQCGVEQRALQLAVGDALPNSTTGQQRRTTRQIVDQVRCLAGTDTPTLAEFHCQSCPVQDGSTARCSPPASQTANGMSVWSPGGVVLLLPVVLLMVMLLMVIGASVVLMKRRRSRRGRKRPPSNSQRSNCREHAVVPEPVYSEIFENPQPHDRQTTSAVTATSSRDHHGALQPEPESENSEVDTPGLSLPRLSSSVYVEMSPPPTGFPALPAYANCDDAGQQRSLYENCNEVKGRKHGQHTYENLHM